MEKKPLNPLLHQRVLEWIQNTPEAPAVASNDCSYTFRELGDRWGQVDAELKGLSPQDRVGIFVDHLALAYPCYLASMGRRSCFVPLNPEFPDQRLADILKDSDPSVLVVSRGLRERLDAILKKSLKGKLSPQIVEVSTDTPKENTPQPLEGKPDDLAYLMFTSGTTGRPKGVMVSQHNLRSFIDWASKTYDISPQDRLSQHSRVSFDLSIFDIFAALSHGACLYPIESKMDLAFPGNFISKHRISICLAVPGVIGTMERAGQLENLNFSSHLRHLLVCGEALSPSLAQAWLNHQEVPLHNLYGPTEATVACTHQPVTQDELKGNRASISIGVPTTDTRIVILHPTTGEELPTGEVGALHLAGDQLGPGYWRNPDQTKKVFIKSKNDQTIIYNTGDLAIIEDDGKLYWMGRQDQQVNILGYRVELPEIEGHIARSSELDPFAIVAMGEPLSIHLVISQRDLEDDGKDQLRDLQKNLEEVLPSYMWPTSLHALDELPRNSNGKIDRKAIVEKLSFT